MLIGAVLEIPTPGDEKTRKRVPKCGFLGGEGRRVSCPGNFGLLGSVKLHFLQRLSYCFYFYLTK